MTSQATSTARKLLSGRTVAGYAADWALFTDWCTTTNQIALPADYTTVLAFTAGCPGAPATIRRRFAAIAHHRAAGHPAPTEPAQKPAAPARELIDPGQVDMLMRLLPSHGWLGGLFGRRDRALRTLAACTTIPYRQLPLLTVGQLDIAAGIPTITDHHGTRHFIEASADPMLCGPTRWCGGAESWTPRPHTGGSTKIDAAIKLACSYGTCRVTPAPCFAGSLAE